MSSAAKRIVISTFGSFGDLHPYIAIALELQRRGHHPVIATSEVYREKTDAVGLELAPVRPVMPSYEEPDQIAELVAGLMDPKIGTRRIFETLVLPHIRDIYDDLYSATDGADILITHPLPLLGPTVAEKRRMLWASTVLSPISFMSVYDPPVPPPLPALHKLLQLSPIVAKGFLHLARLYLASIIEPIYRLREELGLPRGGNPLFEGQHSPFLVLGLLSSVLAKPQPDWPPNTHVTGFAYYDRRDRPGDEAGLQPELKRFLDEGSAPIVFTLGSAAHWVGGSFFHDAIGIARALNRRAVLLIGDERNRPSRSLPNGVVAFEYAPFGELFPRACAIVHLGGIGTTGQALRSGKPSLVMPMSHDQFDNAERVRRLGVACVLPHPKFNEHAAVEELHYLLEDRSYAIRAEEVGGLVRSEDGTNHACDLIEELIEKGSR